MTEIFETQKAFLIRCLFLCNIQLFLSCKELQTKIRCHKNPQLELGAAGNMRTKFSSSSFFAFWWNNALMSVQLETCTFLKGISSEYCNLKYEI